MSFIASVNNSPYALSFAGQATPWREALDEVAHDPQLAEIVAGVVRASDAILSPVRRSLATQSVASLPLRLPAASGEHVVAREVSGVDEAAVSVPGIVAAQLGGVADLMRAGVDMRGAAPSAFEGHSQGVLGVEIARAWIAGDDQRAATIFAVARLIGAAASRATRRARAPHAQDATFMLSVRGLSDRALGEAIAAIPSVALPLSVALRNDTDTHVISGAPADLVALVASIETLARADQAAHAAHERGGRALDPVCEFLPVYVPFHSPILAPALDQVVAWAAQCGIDTDLASRLASAVLTQSVDWPDQIRAATDSGAQWIIDMGPGATTVRMTRSLVEGSGVGVVPAGTQADRDKIATPGYVPEKSANWADLRPHLLELPDGRTVVDTAFSRLTGRSPVLLAGMTPTTVDPQIVAAAANAGFWAEMAGGGQVTEEVYNENLAGLRKLLKPGHTAEFNSMFLDRYLWNLQFGQSRIVSRSRASGAPLDGVVISAGIPEKDEALALISQLRADGFPYVAFKPGTVDQIRKVIDIARDADPMKVIVQVEDGHSGGHHSWEDLSDLLLATYAQLRRQPNIVLTVGGGIGTPQRAADFLSGDWSTRFGRAPMPVDGVLVGTAAMTTKEARTTRAVKELLVATPGVPADDTYDGWVGEGVSRGGMTSGLSHLRADMHEVANAAADAARIIAEIGSDGTQVRARKDEIVEILSHTAKPYFGDLEEMTYEAWVRRFADLSYPWVDPTWQVRYHDLLQRVEARLSPVDHGDVVTLFPAVDDVADAHKAADALLAAYPNAATTFVTPIDAAWFPSLCRSYPKPMPFVPILDDDLIRWWGQDCLWQAQDERYSADQVRIIPGPVSVAGIDRIDEPVADLLGRFEAEATARLVGAGVSATAAVSRLGASSSREEWLRSVPFISWTGHLMTNPASVLDADRVLLEDTATGVNMVILLDTAWDTDVAGTDKHAVRQLVFPLILTGEDGAVPVVDEAQLPTHMYAMLAATAGVGSTSVAGDAVEAMPTMVASQRSPFGEAHYRYSLAPTLGFDHAQATGAALPANYELSSWVPDALLGPAWPAIYAALGSAIYNDYPVIEGLLNAVHLDHSISLELTAEQMLARGITAIDVTSYVADVAESSSGRIVTVALDLSADGTHVGSTVERFAIRGRATTTHTPAEAAPFGGAHVEVVDTPRSVLRRVKVQAPSDMTPFAIVSGDYNPIHTSYAAAKVAGMDAPLVHGMWLSATAQHTVQAAVGGEAASPITGWTYYMYGTVDLDDEVEITVERVGRIAGGGIALEVTCRIDKQVVSRASAYSFAPRVAYVYPGQGIQSAGMGLDERSKSKAVDEVWRRADAHTRSALGFSIVAIVRDNPTEIVARGVTYRHPEGVLNLTQFTQVALATLAIGQTARLREEGALVSGAAFAGHSLGEYDALAAYAQVFPLETVLDLVFQRGSTMHSLVPRDEQGRSNYRMGALRPNQFGIDDANVVDYVAAIAHASGEFLQIVNFNLAGQQYAVAGTVAGLKALEEDANERARHRGAKRAFMYVPGIDVPFHSTVLRDGVADFRAKVDERIPADIDPSVLVGRYIPNLVARPFELTRSFAASIVKVAPSQIVRDLLERPGAWEEAASNPSHLARTLLIELLSWQFASPVRWIETQRVLFTEGAVSDDVEGLGIQHVIEVGLGAAPTLANLASRTLLDPEFSSVRAQVFNVQRDEARVLATDVVVLEADEDEDEATAPALESAPAPTPEAAPAPAAPEATPAAPATGGISGTDVADEPFTASNAIKVLLALSAKIRLEEVGSSDTTESLTNGVSSRRNQLLMDMSSELGLSSIDGAGEADVATLSATVDKAAKGYKAFGPVLSEALKERTRKLFGAAGVKATHITERVTSTWGLGQGWAHHVSMEILLGTREGASTREGDLATLSAEVPANAAGVDALIDAAVQAVATRAGITVALPTAGGSSGGGVVDSAALDAYAASVTGPDGVLAQSARLVLSQLGLDAPAPQNEDESDDARVIDAVAAELGSGWVDLVEPRFDAARAVLLDDRWASAREDVARYANEGTLPESASFMGTGRAVADQATYWANRLDAQGDTERAQRLRTIARDALTSSEDLPYAGEVAVVTGMTPASIGGAVVAGLLAGGATVIATSSSVSAARLSFAKNLYRSHAAGGAALWLLPANLASYRDVDALVEWIGSEQTKSVGADVIVTKPALVPTLFYPFAAPRVSGTMADAGPASENQFRLLLWSVERSIAGLAAIGSDTHADHRLHVVLPGSPNRGIFGGDGAYAEAKASFDAITTRWGAERVWSERVSIAHPRIGWVRGTGLMGGNDPMVEAVEAAGVHTWSTQEMADQLLALSSPEVRATAALAPVDADLTGGLDASIDLRALRAQVEANASAPHSTTESTPTVSALPSPTQVNIPHVDPAQWGNTTASLHDTIVIVGHGEVGPWGSARTRVQAELGIHEDGTVDLTPAGVLELAWMTGLLTWSDTPVGGWYDTDDQLVPESEIFTRYRDEVVARSGVRFFHDDGPLHDGYTPEAALVFLDRDITFTVEDDNEARSYVDADPQFTQATCTAFGEWQVTRKAGAQVRVPRRATLNRRIGGLFPTDFDPARWGIPASMRDSIDPIAVWNLVSAVDAFVSAGFSPAELLRVVHPTTVASTQGTGFGGMRSMHKLFVDRFLGEDYPQDILQETLPNVVAAHTMQSYVGGYGAMVNPVGACATAAVSIEEGVDKIHTGKADFVVAGAIDDIQVESIVGFGAMNATANSNDLLARGISPRFVSRANDRRRGGFVEAQGGGTVLLTRASVALEMNLPVLAVVAHAQTFADGAHTSIPAPGLGALAVARGGKDSALAHNLASLGVSIDDVAFVSKHDTSTNANDPNESDLHTRIGRALGRTPGNPLLVISQKTLTGHAKGGACVFQVGGIIDVFRSGRIPANVALDCVDDAMQAYDSLVWLRSPMNLSAHGPVRAAFATSLGFGHVSGFLALVNPAAFEAIVEREEGAQRLEQWRQASDTRARYGARTVEMGMLGHADLFTPVEARRLPDDPAAGPAGDPHEVEAALLLDPTARLGADGRYHLPTQE